jgi:hypothetical protein
MSIHDFKLVLGPGAEGYQVSFDCPGLVGEGGPYPLPASVIEQAAGQGSRLNTGQLNDLEGARCVGQWLYGAVFRGEVGNAFGRALRLVRSQRQPLRLLLQYAQEHLLHEVPWELLYDGNEFLALSSDVLLTRYIRQTQPVRALAISGPVQLLLTSACPAGYEALDLEAEHREFLGGLEVYPPAACAVSRQPRLSQAQLERHLGGSGQAPVHVWLHSGHGGLLPDQQRFILALENQGQPEEISATYLTAMVGMSPELRLVFLNVCHGGAHIGLAPLLARLNVPAVIGFRTSVLDRIALRFARELANNLLDRPIDRGVRDARRVLQGTDRPVDWALPLLFLRTTEASLCPNLAPRRDLVINEPPSATSGAVPLASVSPPAPPPSPAPPPIAPPVAPPVTPANQAGINLSTNVRGATIGSFNLIGEWLSGHHPQGNPPETTVNINLEAEGLQAQQMNVLGRLAVPPEQLSVVVNLLKSLPNPLP